VALWWQWLIAGGCAWLVGVSKTGVRGLGIFVVPVLGLTMGDAMASAGLLLPLLSVADFFAVAYYRRHAEVRKLWELAPWVALGMALAGVVLFLPASAFPGGPEPWYNCAVGAVVMAMLVLHLLRKRHADAPVPDDVAHAARYGVTAGFATTLANAAGPVMNLYLLSKRLPKHEFIATGAWYFLIVNLLKVPIYVPRGMITWQSLAVDACLAPLVVIGALTGRRLFERIPQRLFERTVLVLAAVAALMLFVPKQWYRPTATAPVAPAAP
jgi:uncharacterized protein